MVFWQLMMVEIVALRFVNVAYVDDADSGIGKIFRGRFTPDDWNGMQGKQNAAGEKLVFVSAAGMGQNGFYH